jgi:hypothetical protein
LQALLSYMPTRSILPQRMHPTNRVTPGTIASPKMDRGNLDFDIRHSFTAGVTYNLPSPGLAKLTLASRSKAAPNPRPW